MRPEPEPSRLLDGSLPPEHAGAGAPGVEVAHATAPALPAAEPRYERGPLLGRGGMGEVHLARDRWLGREVARKSARDRRLEASILHEARVGARLDHPAIVPVHDVGRDASGALCYTMRVVRGAPLSERLRAPSRAPRERLLRALVEVAGAVAHAHDRAIVHRDLKPANVVLGEYGEIQVIDWGLAVDLAAPADGGLTSRGGTPRYMSPEQARGEPPHRADDVWALGAMLYELLAERPPLSELADDQALLAALRSGRRPDLGALAAAPPELVGLLRRVFVSRPERFEARAFVEDLERFLDARPLLSHDYSPLDHVRRLWRAWRTPIIVGLIALAALVAVVVVAMLDTAAERDRALAAEADAEHNLARAIEREVTGLALEGARPEAEALAQTAGAQMTPALRGALASLSAPPAPTPSSVVNLPCCDRLTLDAPASWLLCLEDRGISALHRDAPQRPFEPVWSRPERFREAVILASGEVIAARADDTTARLDLWSGLPLVELPFPHLRNLHASADGHVLVAHENHYLQRWAPDEGAFDRVDVCARRRPVVAFAVSPDGARVAALCEDGALERVAFRPRELLDPVSTPFGRERPEASALAFVGPDRLLVASRRGDLSLLDATSGAVLLDAGGALGPVAELVATPSLVAVLADAGRVRLWSPITGAWLGALPTGLHRHGLRVVEPALDHGPDPSSEVGLQTIDEQLITWHVSDEAALVEHPIGVSTLALSPAGALVAVGDRAGLTLRERATGRVIARHEVPGRMVKGLVVDDAGRVAAVCAEAPGGFTDHTGPLGAALASLPPARRVARLGAGLAVAPYSEGLIVIDGGGHVRTLPLTEEVVDLASAPDHHRVVLADELGRVSTLTPDAETPAVIAELPDVTAVLARATPGVALAVTRHGPRVLELPSQRVVAELADGAAVITRLALSPDERWLALGTLAGRVEVFDAAGRLALTFPAHDERVSGLAFIANPPELVSAGWDGRVRRFDLADLGATSPSLP